MPSPIGDEYTAQCWGGPQHGNPISASVKEWPYHEDHWMWLDGLKGMPTVTSVKGKYVYDHHQNGGQPMWRWVGPGANGDTMERLRLQPRREGS
jgi:hypothetical protein